MKDLAYAFTLCFATLGPTKTIPVFYLATRSADWRTVLALAAKSTLVATAIVLFVALSASGTLLSWRVSIEAVEIAGGIVLALAAIKTLTSPAFAAAPSDGAAPGEPKQSTAWMGRPVLAPLAVPGIVPPVGIMVVLFFAATALGDARQQSDLVVVLVAIMTMNFVAMLAARPIMRVVGVPVLQVTGWALSAVQAGLGVQAIIGALRALHI
jgi:multiple antibiotic resistance protein